MATRLGRIGVTSHAIGTLRDGGALGISVVLVGVFGFLSWGAVARLADRELVGTASVLVNAMMLAATVGQMQLGSVILRWLPEAGTAQLTLLRRTYAVVAATCTVVGTAVALLLFSGMVVDADEGTVFVVAVVVWAIFSLQDQVLTALLRASVVPFENGIYVVLRLALLPLCVPLGAIGVLIAWTGPALLLVLGVSSWLPKLLRQSVSSAHHIMPRRKELTRFVAGNWFATLAQLAVWNGLPLLVTSIIGSAQGGVFFVIWSTVLSVELAAVGFSSALIVRAGSDPTRLAGLMRVVGLWFGAVFVPALVLLAVVARPVLLLFGPVYADQGSAALRLLAIGMIFRLVSVVAIGVAQSRKQTRPVVTLQVAYAACLLAAVSIAVPRLDKEAALPAVAGYYLCAAAVGAAGGFIYLFRSRRLAMARKYGSDPVVQLAVVSLVCVWGGGKLTDADRVGMLGLVNALHPVAWIGLVLLAVAMTVEVFRRQPRLRIGYGLGVLFAIEAYGLQPLIYSAARLPVAWLHAGWSDYVAVQGTVPRNFDARFSWPGFFELSAMLTRSSGLESATGLLQWAPVFFASAWTLPFLLIARSLRLSPRVACTGLWIFLAANWVEQEYFSPQAVAYLMYLSIVALALMVLGGRGALPRWVPQRLRSDERTHMTDATPRQRAVTVALLTLMMIALAPSHQLTPYVLAIALALVVVLAGVRPAGLVLVAVVTPLTWLVVGAHDFWAGHFHVLTQDIGDVSRVVDNNITARMVGQAAREVAQALRIALMSGVALLALLGAVRMWSRRSGLVILLAGLACAPATFALVQSYGGEMLIRVWLFALPWLALMAAHHLERRQTAPRGSRRRQPSMTWWRPTFAYFLSVVVLVAGLGLFCRSANDGYTRVSQAQVNAMREVYSSALPGQRLVVIESYLPWKFDRITSLSQQSVSNHCPASETIARCVLDADADIVVVTDEQDLYGRLVAGRPRGWTGTVIDQLLSTRRFRVWRENSDVTVLRRKVPTVLALGDSITRGDADPEHGTNGSRAWPAMLAAMPRNRKVTVTNAGVQGQLTAQMRQRLPQLLAEDRPDLVVIFGGTNDAWQGRPVSATESDLAAMIAMVRDSGALPLLVTIPPQQTASIQTTKPRAAAVAQVNSMIVELAETTGTTLADSYSVLAGPDGRWQRGMTLDGVHPTRGAAQRIADVIGTQVDLMLEPAMAGPAGTVVPTPSQSPEKGTP